MIFRILTSLILSSLLSCSSIKQKSDNGVNQKIQNLESILDLAEENASPEGRTILLTGRSMIKKRKVIVGSCWDFINAVYNRAKFPASKRVTALKSKIVGPFADVSELRPGDWLYFINHSYSEVDHSGIFVEWIDIDLKHALILSYKGGNHKTPATYKVYHLDNVYYIIRPKLLTVEQ